MRGHHPAAAIQTITERGHNKAPMTAEGKISNYEKMKDDAAAAFLRFDQEEMIRKFALEHDKMYLYICFAGKRYRISRTTGKNRNNSPYPLSSNSLSKSQSCTGASAIIIVPLPCNAMYT